MAEPWHSMTDLLRGSVALAMWQGAPCARACFSCQDWAKVPCSARKPSIELPFCQLKPYSAEQTGGAFKARRQGVVSVVEVLRSPGHVVLGHGAGVGRGVLVPEWVDPVLAQLLQILPALLQGNLTTLLEVV